MNLKRRRRVVRLCRQRDTMIFVGKSSFAQPPRGRSLGLLSSPSLLVSSPPEGADDARAACEARSGASPSMRRPRPIDRPKTETALRGPSLQSLFTRAARPSVSSFPIHPDYSQGPAIPSSLPDCKRNNRFSPSFARRIDATDVQPSRRNFKARGVGAQIWAK